MADGSDAAGPSSAGGQGRLAQLIATRGGLASPEAPFVIEHREALIYMLCEAAELEHGIMCQYLFAAFSLKQSTSEGLTDDEAATVTRWRQRGSHVAPLPRVHLALLPPGEQALHHFMLLEHREGMDQAGAGALAAVGRPKPLLSERDIVP